MFVGLSEDISDEDNGVGSISAELAQLEKREMKLAKKEFGEENVEHKFLVDMNMQPSDLGTLEAIRSGNFSNGTPVL